MYKKCLAIVLSVSLALCLLVQGSFAYSTGQDTNIVSLVNSINLHQSAGDLHSVLLSYIQAHGADMEGYQYIFCSCASNNNSFYTFQSDGMLYQASNRYIYSTSSSDIYMAYLGNNRLDVPTWTLTWDNTTTSSFGITFYRFRYPYDIATIPNDVWYANYSIITDLVDLLLLSNLDATGYVYNPDSRILDAYEAWFGGETYIQVEVNDNILQWGSFVTVHGETTDTHIGFYYTFRSSDYLQIGVDDGIYYFKLNPRLIPWESFVLDSLEYVGSSEYGSKTVELPDLEYGYTPISEPPLVTEYHYTSTSEVHYTTESASRYIYSMTNSLLRLNENFSPVLFCDDQLRCAQKFNYSTIFLPYCLTDLQIDFEEFFVECVNYYDLVVLDVDETCFDILYGTGSYDEIENHLQTNPSYYLASWYKSHYSTANHLGFVTGGDDPNFQLTTTNSCNVTFYFTTSWFFKQINFLLGDTGDVLTELSERFFQVDGFSDTLLGSLSDWASYQEDFYNTLLPKLTPIISLCNDITLGDYFNKIINKLQIIVDSLYVPELDLPIADDVIAMGNAFVQFWVDMFEGASSYAVSFVSTLSSLTSSDPQVYSLPEDPQNIALPVYPSPSVPLLPTLTLTPVPIGG